MNRGQELVIGGYIPGPHGFDSIIVGCYVQTPNSGLAVIAPLLLSLLDNFLSLILDFARYQPQNPPTSPGPFTLYDKKTQMARYLRIRSIVKTERTGAHERVKAICGLTPEGSHWTLTHEDAVSQVENRTCAFYIERPKDKRYDVIVAMDVRAHKYLKTDADRDQPDELLFLPACHHVVHTSYAVPGRHFTAAA